MLHGSVAVALIAVASVASAQAHRDSLPRDTAFHLRRVIITGTNPVTTREGGSAFDARLDSLRMPAAPTLDAALRRVPFVQVRTNARGESYFSLRGSGFDARDIAVLVDGLPASLNFDHRADLALLPLSGARTLTVVRGLPSLLYGPNVVGGVAEVGVARQNGDPSAPASATLSTDVDGTGAYGTSGAFFVPVGNLTVRAGGGTRHVDGVPLPHGVSEPAGFGDGDLRLNSDRRQDDGFLATRYQTSGGGWIAASTMAYSGRRGTPAELGTTTPQLLRFPVLRRDFTIVSSGTGERESPFGGRASLEASAGYDRARTKLNGYTTRAYTTIKNTEDDDDHNGSARILASQTIGSNDAGDIRTSFTYSDLRRHEILTPGATSSYRQQLWSGASELGWTFAGVPGFTSLRPSAGVGYDGADTPETGGKIGVPVRRLWAERAGIAGATMGGDLTLHAGVNHRARFPSLREMYSGTLSQIEPNPELRPEVMTSIDAGASTRLGGAQVEVVGFRNAISDAIVRSTTPQKKVKRVNRDTYVTSGVELLLSGDAGPATLSGDATLQSSNSRNPLTAQEFHAEYQPNFLGGAHLAMRLPGSVRAMASVRGTSAQYCLSTAGVYTRLAGVAEGDAEVSRRWSLGGAARWLSGVATSVSLDNLSNAAVYDQCGLPRPGRLLRFQIRLD